MDYERLFTDALFSALKEKIKGGIFVRVYSNDTLVVKISHHDNDPNFEMKFDNFSQKILHGWSTSYAAYEIVSAYKKHVLRNYFV